MGLISLLFPILLALILIIVLFGIIYLIKKREGEIKDEMKLLRDKLNDIDDIDEVLDTETLEEELEKILEEEFKPCLFPPYSNGTCDKGYRIETGEDTGKKCCYPEKSIQPSKFQKNLKLANRIIQEILIALVISELLERMVKKLVGKTSVKAGGKVAVSSTVRAAKRAALASKTAAMSIRTIAKTGSRAVFKTLIGGKVGAAFLAIDVIGMVLDIKDTAGYASFIPQGTFQNTKNVIDTKFFEAMEVQDLEFPMLYPLGLLYGANYEAGLEVGQAKLIDKYFLSDMELENNSEYKKAFDDYVDALVDSIVNETGEPEFPKKIEDYAIKILEDHYTERDELIYEELKNFIGLANCQLYPKISSPTTIGITLTQEGARKLNESNKNKWLTDDPDDENIEVALTAIYTDKYYIYDKDATGQSEDNPIMEEVTLPEKTVLATGYGTLFSMCEKRRKLKSSSAAITPTNYGSYFDFENSKCVFTSSLCNRYGLKLENNDCVEREGQKIAEMAFGTTITRASITEWTDRLDTLKSRDSGLQEKTDAVWRSALDFTGLISAIADQPGMEGTNEIIDWFISGATGGAFSGFG